MTRNAFKSVLKKVAVTEISFSDPLLFSSIGGDLLVFDSSDGFKLIKRQNILDNQALHGLLINKDKNVLCSFGGKLLVISKLENHSKSLQVECICKWRVRDWVLSCAWLESSQLAALTAHNQLILFNHETGQEITSVASTEKCILYCGSIIVGGKGWTDVVVIAGTVFQQVIIWSVTDSSTGDRQILHTLNGHKGVIFSVLFDYRSCQILSTSDDRSVRVWSVKCSEGLLSADDWRNASISLAYSVFGHTSRVWQSYCLQNEDIVSIGEDSMLCVWRKGGECESRRETHQGGGVWCMEVIEKLGVVVTGGADGGISVWPLESRVSMCSLPAPPEAPRRTQLLSKHDLLVTTDTGNLLLHSDNSWHTVYSNCKFSNYCLLETSPSRQRVALASIRGEIVILNSVFEKLLEEKISNDKIYSVHWLSNDCLLTCHNLGEVCIWKLTKSAELEKVQQLSLPACKERWTTAAVSCGSVVVFGDRMGNLHSAPLLPSTVQEVCTVARAHSRLGVCSLSVHDGRVWSTGRDGTIKQFMLIDHHSLWLVSSSKLPLDWAAQLIHSPLFGLVALCFHETHLVLWSVNERRQLTSVQCGGGHRSWSFLLDDDNLSFVFLKSKTAHKLVCPVGLISRPNILEGFHVREVNCMSCVQGENTWLVSGGEDGSVRLSHYNTAENSWRVCSTEYSHVSSVRSVTSCTLDINQTLVFSAGGRAQLKVWRIHFDNSGSRVLVELTSLMLRDERRGQHWLNSVPVSDPETRYMDLEIAAVSDSTVYLVAACSDAYLRIFYFDVARNNLELHTAVKHSENCLLRVKSFRWPDGSAGAVTAGTDGHLVFWDLDVQSGVTPVLREQVHQSGVNALSVTHTPASDKLLVVTGGDDNALQVTCYQLSSKQSRAVCKCASWTSSTLHSSVISGVEVDQDLIVCGGGDQRVTLLSWQLSGNQLSVQVLDQYCCSVPDVKGLTLLKPLSNKCFVCLYGVGAEILELKNERR